MPKAVVEHREAQRCEDMQRQTRPRANEMSISSQETRVLGNATARSGYVASAFGMGFEKSMLVGVV